MSLYKARLFRLMLEDRENNKYEAYKIGMVIVSKRGRNCKEYLYGVTIPVCDSKIGEIHETGDHIGSYNIRFYNDKNVKKEYIVLGEDLTEKNKMTTKDLLKFNFNCYANMAMKLMKYDETPVKKLFKTKME